MDFPYIEDLGLEEERIFRPMLPVTFKANGESFKSYALVDSGSDYTILSIEVAGILKLRLTTEREFHLQGAGGNIFRIYKSPERVEQTIEKRGFRPRKFSSHVYFAESGSVILLGQKGFLDHLNVKLKGPKKELEVSC